MKYAVLGLFLSISAQAGDDWLCKTQATERAGNVFHSCGVATATDENAARLAAFENARKEFTAVCQASDDCMDRDVLVHPARTDCAAVSGGVRCYRAVHFTIQDAKPNTLGVTPFHSKGRSISAIAKGMSKSDLFKKFGTPNSISENGYGRMQVFFKGPMCVYELCYVIVDNGRVDSFDNVRPEYTDLMN